MKSNPKKDFLSAVLAGDKEKARRLGNLIKLAADREMPLFIVIKRHAGKIVIDWKELTLTEVEFEQLKGDLQQVVFWEEERIYETEK